MKKTQTQSKKASAKVVAQSAEASVQVIATEAAKQPAEAPAEAAAPAPAAEAPKAKEPKTPSPQQVFLAGRCQLSREMQKDITKRFRAGQFEVKTMSKDTREKIKAAISLQIKNLGPLWEADYKAAGLELNLTYLVNEICEAFISDPMFKPYEHGLGPIQVARVVRKILDPKAPEAAPANVETAAVTV